MRKTTDLHKAAQEGKKQWAEQLIAQGAEVNAEDRDENTPLFRAAWAGHQEVAQLLIDKGADVNAHTEYGTTPLFATARGAIPG